MARRGGERLGWAGLGKAGVEARANRPGLSLYHGRVTNTTARRTSWYSLQIGVARGRSETFARTAAQALGCMRRRPIERGRSPGWSSAVRASTLTRQPG